VIKPKDVDLLIHIKFLQKSFFLNIIGSLNVDRRRSRSRSSVRRSSSRNKEHLVKIRGMPFTVVEDDIRKV